MATLGDLKQRIIAETLRDDLADDLAAQLTLIIQKSIDQYAANRWWFNEKATTLVTSPGVVTVALPSNFRFLDKAWLLLGGTAAGMRELSATEWADLSLAVQSGGQPYDFAILDTNMYLWPTPNAAYSIRVLYVGDVTPGLDYTSDTSSNVWTNQGQDLITARAKLRLYRDYLSVSLQDPRVVQANNQEAEAYSRLRAEHNRRISTNRVRAGW